MSMAAFHNSRVAYLELGCLHVTSSEFRMRLWQSGMLVFLFVALLARVSLAAPPGSGWHLIHADEFSDSVVDSVKWDTRYQWGRTHNHDAYMQDSNVQLDGGLIDLNATREAASGKPFSSGVISSHSKFRYTQGYAEMRIKMPDKQGSWPAFWMLDNGWPPEIDIMEYPIFTDSNIQDRYAVNSFWGSGSNPPSNFSWIDRNIDLGNDFHTYGLEWNSSQLKYYFDGQLVKTASNQSSFQNMYLIFNYAVGGWPGAPSQEQWADGETDTTQADWVRVWQKPASIPDTTWTFQGSNSGSWGTGANWSSGSPAYSRQRAFFSTLSSQNTMLVNWQDSKTLGEMRLSGDTVYTFGEPGADVENIMFADENDGWARLWVDDGAGGHIVNSRLDAWSHLSLRNLGTNPLTINGDIVGQTRSASDGGKLLVRGDGDVILNGEGRYQGTTTVTEGSSLIVNGSLYQGRVEDETQIEIELDSVLSLGTLNDFGTGDLGNLPRSRDHLVIDGGTLEIRNSASTKRGFTVGPLGAELAANTRDEVRFRKSALASLNVDSPNGGTLTLAGSSIGHLDSAIPGGGGLIKSETGTWTLGGSNTYTGTTQVLAGKLIVDGSSGTGLHQVSGGATLGGQGTLAGAVSNHGTLAPGRPVELGRIAALQGPVDTGVVTALSFDFNGVQDDAPLTQTSSLNSNVALTHGFDFGPGLSPRNAADAGDEFNVQGYSNGDLSAAIAAEDYLTFSVQPIVGIAMTLDSIDVNLWRNGVNAATNYAVLTNLDGFEAGAQLGSVTVTDAGIENQHLFSSSYTGNAELIDEELEVRIYGWGANTSNGNTHFNAVSMTANFTSVSNIALDPTGILTLNGNYTQFDDGMLAIDLGGDDNSDSFDPFYDSLSVSGTATLDGALQVSLHNIGNGLFQPELGQSFEILHAAGGVAGSFSELDLPGLATGLSWHVSYGSNNVELLVVSSADFNSDGNVDYTDLAMWEAGYGLVATREQGDADGSGLVDGNDFLVWQSQFGTTASAQNVSPQSIPEPSTQLLLGCVFGLLLTRFSRVA